MSFFAVLCALLVEQLKPLPRDNWVYHRLVAWVASVGRNFDAGKARHVWVVWGVSVGVPTLLVALVYLGLRHYSAVAAVAFDVAVLYLSLGFRQFSHYFTDIRDALDRGDENEARRLLAEWRHLDANELPYALPEELARDLAAELATVPLHRYPPTDAGEHSPGTFTHALDSRHASASVRHDCTTCRPQPSSYVERPHSPPAPQSANPGCMHCIECMNSWAKPQ